MSFVKSRPLEEQKPSSALEASARYIITDAFPASKGENSKLAEAEVGGVPTNTRNLAGLIQGGGRGKGAVATSWSKET